MDNNLKKYKVSVDSDVFAISLVSDPAIEETFVALSADKPKVFVSEEKHMVYGAALRPNFPIYRNDDDGEYYLVFDKEAIEKMSVNFMKSYRQRNVTLQHEEDATEMCVVESWLKADKDIDKSVALGLDKSLPVGTWFVGMKVNNIDTWRRIKQGELRGFSVEAMIGLDEFSKQTNINKEMNKEMNEEMIANEGFWTKLTNTVREIFEKKEEMQLLEETTPQEPAPTNEPQQNTEPPKVEEPVVEEPKVEEPKVENPIEEVIKNLQTELEELRKSNMELAERLGKKPSASPVNVDATPKHDVKGVDNPNFIAWRDQVKGWM